MKTSLKLSSLCTQKRVSCTKPSQRASTLSSAVSIIFFASNNQWYQINALTDSYIHKVWVKELRKRLKRQHSNPSEVLNSKLNLLKHLSLFEYNGSHWCRWWWFRHDHNLKTLFWCIILLLSSTDSVYQLWHHSIWAYRLIFFFIADKVKQTLMMCPLTFICILTLSLIGSFIPKHLWQHSIWAHG